MGIASAVSYVTNKLSVPVSSASAAKDFNTWINENPGQRNNADLVSAITGAAGTLTAIASAVSNNISPVIGITANAVSLGNNLTKIADSLASGEQPKLSDVNQTLADMTTLTGSVVLLVGEMASAGVIGSTAGTASLFALLGGSLIVAGTALTLSTLSLSDNDKSSIFDSMGDIANSIGNNVLEVANGIANSIGDGLSDIFNAITALGNLDEWQTHISELINDLFNTAAKFVQPRRDPLALDLDGDGLETVGTSAGILFDHDGDGIKNGTGWVKADDGLLVMDKNGNGSIDNGHELFGDAFVKGNGQLAADGFDALASLDGNGDGKVDVGDAQFGNLKVWQDLNQDGLSQAGELFTLAQLGIASINVTSTDHNQTLANGNQIADLGTYTKTDGSLGTTGEVIGDINLATDTFHRQFPDHLDTSAVAHLPDMQGSGAVRGLREAANDCRWRMAA
ncbi:MAG: hypothetical protein ABL884_02680 [Methyloglobulus sp.]